MNKKFNYKKLAALSYLAVFLLLMIAGVVTFIIAGFNPSTSRIVVGLIELAIGAVALGAGIEHDFFEDLELGDN